MNLFEFYKKVAKGDEFPLYFRFPILLFSSWTFQSILYMDKTEKFFKILLDILFFSLFYFALSSNTPSQWNAPVSLIIGHTLNWVLNANVFGTLKLLGLTRTKPERFATYLDSVNNRVAKEKSILILAVFGSLSRRGLEETSDLDIRIVRRKGLVNGLKACLFCLLERTRAFTQRFPLDIYLLDDSEKLSRLSENPVILYKADLNESFKSSEFNDF